MLAASRPRPNAIRINARGSAGSGVPERERDVARDWSIEGMELADLPEPAPGPGQVAVRMKAASLNYRDLLTVQGKGGVSRLPLIPFSDGAGEVIAVGDGVARVAVGDRVCPCSSSPGSTERCRRQAAAMRSAVRGRACCRR